MNALILKDKEMFPTDEVLENVLKSSYPAFARLRDELTATDVRIEWNYYDDGKAWMGKMLFKKKNLGWLQIYDGYCTTSCFFMERHLEAIDGLDITESIKTNFYQQKSSGKLTPMTVNIHTAEDIDDTLKMLDFKKKLK